MFYLNEKGNQIVSQVSLISKKTTLTPEVITAIMAVVVALIELLKAWKYSPESGVSSLRSPGILTRWLINRAISKGMNELEYDYGSYVKQAIPNMAESTTVYEMEALYKEV